MTIFPRMITRKMEGLALAQVRGCLRPCECLRFSLSLSSWFAFPAHEDTSSSQEAPAVVLPPPTSVTRTASGSQLQPRPAPERHGDSWEQIAAVCFFIYVPSELIVKKKKKTTNTDAFTKEKKNHTVRDTLQPQPVSTHPFHCSK